MVRVQQLQDAPGSARHRYISDAVRMEHEPSKVVGVHAVSILKGINMFNNSICIH